MMFFPLPAAPVTPEVTESENKAPVEGGGRTTDQFILDLIGVAGPIWASSRTNPGDVPKPRPRRIDDVRDKGERKVSDGKAPANKDAKAAMGGNSFGLSMTGLIVAIVLGALVWAITKNTLFAILTAIIALIVSGMVG